MLTMSLRTANTTEQTAGLPLRPGAKPQGEATTYQGRY